MAKSLPNQRTFLNDLDGNGDANCHSKARVTARPTIPKLSPKPWAETEPPKVSSQLIKWHGGKSGGIANWIHSLAPPSVHEDPAHGYTHRNIAFAGGLGEFWNWHPIDGISEAINDKNRDVTNLYSVVRDDVTFKTFSHLVNLTPFAQDDFERCRDLLNSKDQTPVQRAVNFFITNRLGRQGLGRDYATPTTRTRRGMSEHVSAYLSSVDGFPECHERLRSVEVRNLDFREFIRAYDHPRAFFYLDPVYLADTRSGGGEYGAFEMSRDDHVDLLRLLVGLEGKFELSGLRSVLYDEYANAHGWSRYERQVTKSSSSAKTKARMVECVWCNY